MGYELKLFATSGKELQRPSLRPKDSERFFRFDRLGEDYSLDEISNRILENIRRKDPFPEETMDTVRKYRSSHPPKCKAGGLARLYYFYCYELHIIVRFPASVKKVSHFMREDIRKLDKLDAQTRFLGENGIETYEDLESYQDRTEEEIGYLKRDRDQLRNELKRVIRKGDEAEILAVKGRISVITAKIRKGYIHQNPLCNKDAICRALLCLTEIQKARVQRLFYANKTLKEIALEDYPFRLHDVSFRPSVQPRSLINQITGGLLRVKTKVLIAKSTQNRAK